MAREWSPPYPRRIQLLAIGAAFHANAPKNARWYVIEVSKSREASGFAGRNRGIVVIIGPEGISEVVKACRLTYGNGRKAHLRAELVDSVPAAQIVRHRKEIKILSVSVEKIE
jgi:hypothetical protein